MRQLKVFTENYKRIKNRGDQGEKHQVMGYIDRPQALSLGNLMTPLSWCFFTEIMKKILKHTIMQYINTIIKHKIKCQTWSYSWNSESDIMYYPQAIKYPDPNQFREEMVKYFNNHTGRNPWKVVPIEDVPAWTRILYSIWSMKLKRDILSGRVIKYKASLTIYV